MVEGHDDDDDSNGWIGLSVRIFNLIQNINYSAL